MNMKTLVMLGLMGILFSAQAQVYGPHPEEPTEKPLYGLDLLSANQPTTNTKFDIPKSGSVTDRCRAIVDATKEQKQSLNQTQVQDCENLLLLTKGSGFTTPVVEKDTIVKSQDGQISCVKKANFTIDYEKCAQAVTAYNYVVAAEGALVLQQKIRTDAKHKNIQADAQQKAASGDHQGSMLDAASEAHNHEKEMNKEKAATYSLAMGALMRAYGVFPGPKEAYKLCGNTESCKSTVANNKNQILANSSAKAGLATAITKFMAKAAAAGIAINQHDNAANTINKAKDQIVDDGDDMMMEFCVFNPTHASCVKGGVRTPGESFAGGDFSFGGDGTNNAFSMGPAGSDSFEEGAATNLGNDSVASMASPFADEAKRAQGILDPAGEAVMQATGGAGGGGGGVGGGMGGGSASLGSDLDGVDKEGNKEANIKTNKVSGVYSAAGGGGFKGVGKGSEDANPFASLFDSKGTAGGIEEDRSIASGDIDGQASGLFQKISKRYGQIQADKRIEANNLE